MPGVPGVPGGGIRENEVTLELEVILEVREITLEVISEGGTGECQGCRGVPELEVTLEVIEITLEVMSGGAGRAGRGH